MAYVQEVLGGAVVMKSPTVFATAENLAAATGTYGQYLVMKSIYVTRLEFMVSAAVTAGTGAPVVTFYRRPTMGSDSGRVAIGTITVPNSASVGQVIYKDVTPVLLSPGEEISMARTTQATDGGTAAGQGYYGFVAELKPESPANCTNMVASA